MSQRTSHRLYSFAMAAIITLGTLGGIDQLWQPAEVSQHWAQQQSSVHA